MGRKTQQERKIEEEIKNLNSFFDAEKLHERVFAKNNKIGIATVYRFLKKLTEEGKIHSYSCNRRVIYSSDLRSHCHFTCEECGEISHVNVEKLDFLKEKVRGDVCHFQINIAGVCEKCQE